MIEAFLKSNDSSAEITKDVQKDSLAKCTLFIGGDIPLITVTKFREMPSIEKLKELFKLDNLKLADNEKTDQITGYKKEVLPPIAVYGVTVIIDEKLMNKEFLFFGIAGANFLKIKPLEIIELNEESEIKKITN